MGAVRRWSGALASRILWREVQATVPCNDGSLCWISGRAWRPMRRRVTTATPMLCAWDHARQRGGGSNSHHLRNFILCRTSAFARHAAWALSENAKRGALADVAVSLAVLFKKRQKFRSVVGFRSAPVEEKGLYARACSPFLLFGIYSGSTGDKLALPTGG